MELTPNAQSGPRPATGRLSYKFQRLREKIRQAIQSGELSGKLPGERTMAKRFHANAKTLSKALTDLAAEGLLERSIGRGTYVRGSVPAAAQQGKWLLLCDPADADSPLVRQLIERVPEAEVSTDAAHLRPSYLSQFTTVLDLSTQTPDAMLRDLVVRNLNVLLVGREPGTYSVPAVEVDRAAGAAALGRDLLLRGHRNLAAVQGRRSTILGAALRAVADRLAPDATIESCDASEVPAMVEHGATAFVCESPTAAQEVRAALDRMGVDIPRRVSLAAVGCIGDQPPCSGWYVTAAEKAEQIVLAVRDLKGRRPVTLWLAGRFVDAGTIGQTAGAVETQTPMRLSAAV